MAVTGPRTFGVEEELLLTDTSSMNLRPVARDVVLACAGAGPGDPEIKHEFFLEQVEVATRPCATSDDLRAQLVRGRQLVADTARPFGVVPVAAPVPVLAGSSGTPSPGKRYGRVRDTYGRIAEDSLYCALQVHVEVEDDEQAVGVLDRLRPWVPVLLAVSANSPYWRGSDTGFASWRSQLWDRWPSSGPREPFGTMAGYRRAVANLVTSGAILDEAMLNLDIRRSARFSTVELRLTDVCTDVDDAVALACLTRGLVAAAAEEWLRGTSAPEHWSVGRLRVARDTAARNGLSGALVHPVTGTHQPALSALEAAVGLASPALEEAGDTALVGEAMGRWMSHGTGAARQRLARARARGLEAVVEDLAARTTASQPTGPDRGLPTRDTRPDSDPASGTTHMRDLVGSTSHSDATTHDQTVTTDW